MRACTLTFVHVGTCTYVHILSLCISAHVWSLLHIMQDDSDSTHIFDHYLFTGWPDYGVPKYPTFLIHMLYHVRDARVSDVPILVHCRWVSITAESYFHYHHLTTLAQQPYNPLTHPFSTLLPTSLYVPHTDTEIVNASSTFDMLKNWVPCRLSQSTLRPGSGTLTMYIHTYVVTKYHLSTVI